MNKESPAISNSIFNILFCFVEENDFERKKAKLKYIILKEFAAKKWCFNAILIYIFFPAIVIKLIDWLHLLLNKNNQEAALLVTVGLFVSKII